MSFAKISVVAGLSACLPTDDPDFIHGLTVVFQDPITRLHVAISKLETVVLTSQV